MNAGAAVRALAVRDRFGPTLRRVGGFAGAAVGCVAAAYVLAERPWFATGVVVGGVLLLVLLLRPLAVLAAMLALGPIDLSFMTGGFKALLPGLGGLDMNGIRLIGIVTGFAAVTLVDGELLRHALGRHGRWYLLFLVFGAASLVYSDGRVDGLRLLFKLAYPFLMFIAVSSLVRTREELERLADWALVGGIAIAVVLNPFFVLAGGYEVDVTGRIRVQGVGVHENPFSFYLLVVTLIAFARYSMRGQVRYLLLCGVFGLWMALTLTRITLLASLTGLIGVATYGALVARNYRAVGGAALLCTALAVPLVPVALERSLGYIPTATELLGLVTDPVAFWQAVNWQGRQVLWPVVFKAFLTSPVIGLGLGSSTAVLHANFSTAWGGVVHNEYIRLLVDTGVVGSALFAAAVLVWCRGVLRAGRREDPLVREFALPAFAGIVAWAIIAATDNAFDYYAQFTQYIGFLCGGALTAAALAPEETE